MRYIVESENLTISYTVKKTPRIDGVFLRKMKNMILTTKYDLNIYFVGKKKMREVNKKYRNKDYVTDILSFPFLDDDFGEIYICLEKANKKAKDFNTTEKKYLDYIIMHGMIHLTGLDHGERMDNVEKRYSNRLNIFYPY
jgi:probable rRNA maturation factor